MKRRTFLRVSAAALLGCADGRSTYPRDSVIPLTGPEGGPAPILGMNSHRLLDDDLRLIREVGITHVRTTLLTPAWTSHPTYALSARENVARAADYGIALLVVVHNAAGHPFRMPYDLEAARAFTATVEEMMRALPTVESWQLWNEQDVWTQAPFGSGAQPPMDAERLGANYGRWWIESYERLKAIRPDATLVTGAVADHASNRWRGFLRGMVETGLVADAIGFHRYGPWYRVRWGLLEAWRIAGAVAPIWLTEFGAPGGADWSPGNQADAWRGTIEGNESERIAARVYPYCLQTDPRDPWYGVRDLDGSPRPVLDWLRARAAGA